MKTPRLSPFDQLIAAADRALRTLASEPQATRANPASALPSDGATPLSERERREAAALMRVNHVGEVCAQAMYDAQALAATEPELREKFVARCAGGGRPSGLDAATNRTSSGVAPAC